MSLKNQCATKVPPYRPRMLEILLSRETLCTRIGQTLVAGDEDTTPPDLTQGQWSTVLAETVPAYHHPDRWRPVDIRAHELVGTLTRADYRRQAIAKANAKKKPRTRSEPRRRTQG